MCSGRIHKKITPVSWEKWCRRRGRGLIVFWRSHKKITPVLCGEVAPEEGRKENYESAGRRE